MKPFALVLMPNYFSLHRTLQTSTTKALAKAARGRGEEKQALCDVCLIEHHCNSWFSSWYHSVKQTIWPLSTCKHNLQGKRAHARGRKRQRPTTHLVLTLSITPVLPLSVSLTVRETKAVWVKPFEAIKWFCKLCCFAAQRWARLMKECVTVLECGRQALPSWNRHSF